MVFETLGVFFSKIMMFTGFVQEASSFKKPLEKEEEAQILKQCKAGDKHARDILIEHNLRLVAHIVKKFQNCGEADDLISVGTIGLIKAINSFDMDKNASLSTYASRCIENEILMMLRSNKKHMKNISLESALSKDPEGNELTYFDTLSTDQPDMAESVENKLLINKILIVMKKYLTTREYDVIVMRYGLDGHLPHAQREVAKKLNISRSYISRIENKAIEILQEKCAIEGIEDT